MIDLGKFEKLLEEAIEPEVNLPDVAEFIEKALSCTADVSYKVNLNGDGFSGQLMLSSCNGIGSQWLNVSNTQEAVEDSKWEELIDKKIAALTAAAKEVTRGQANSFLNKQGYRIKWLKEVKAELATRLKIATGNLQALEELIKDLTAKRAEAIAERDKLNFISNNLVPSFIRKRTLNTDSYSGKRYPLGKISVDSDLCGTTFSFLDPASVRDSVKAAIFNFKFQSPENLQKSVEEFLRDN